MVFDVLLLGSCGQLLPNTRMKVIDLDSGEEKEMGETGELCFAGPQVMPGYFNNEKATAETLIDGWIHTGDIGHYDEVNTMQKQTKTLFFSQYFRMDQFIL